MRHQRLRPLRQQDGDPVAADHAQPGEHVGKSAGELVQLLEAVSRNRPGSVVVNQRLAIAAQVPVADGMRDVEAWRNRPGELPD